MRKEEEDSAAALRGKEGKGSRKGGQGRREVLCK